MDSKAMHSSKATVCFALQANAALSEAKQMQT